MDLEDCFHLIKVSKHLEKTYQNHVKRILSNLLYFDEHKTSQNSDY